MRVGAEDKRKVALAVGLSLVAAVVVYVQFFSAPSPVNPGTAVTRSAPPGPSLQKSSSRSGAPRAAGRVRRAARSRQFDPVWRSSREQADFSPLAADPTLRTDRLEAVRQVEFRGVERNLFEFAARKSPVEPPPPEQVVKAQNLQKQFEQRIAQEKKRQAQPAVPAARRAPRLTWKYYGFASAAGSSRRRAFLLDRDEVLIGGVGDVLRGRYRIVRIGLDSIVIEDLEFSERQTLPITAPRG